MYRLRRLQGMTARAAILECLERDDFSVVGDPPENAFERWVGFGGSDEYVFAPSGSRARRRSAREAYEARLSELNKMKDSQLEVLLHASRLAVDARDYHQLLTSLSHLCVDRCTCIVVDFLEAVLESHPAELLMLGELFRHPLLQEVDLLGGGIARAAIEERARGIRRGDRIIKRVLQKNPDPSVPPAIPRR